MTMEDSVQPKPKPSLFAQHRFAVVRGHGLEDEEADQILGDLRLHGAEAELDHYSSVGALQSGGRPALEGITYIISNTFDFPDYDAACDAFIPVVRPSWVTVSIAKNKMANPRSYNTDPRLFMSGVVVCCADIPEGDEDAIKGGVLAMGGLFTSRVAVAVTHLVALTTDNPKCEAVLTKKMDVKIVLPHWFDDCLKLGRRIDEGPYLLPNPEIGRQLSRPPTATLSNLHIAGASHPDPSISPGLAPVTARKSLDVFLNKNVMLAKNLGIGSHLRGILEDLIVNGHGKVATSVSKANMYICKYREGNDYKLASRTGKDVGNLAWLYYLITNNVWTSPTRRLLHYPVAKEGLAGFENLRISLSNYSGEARSYLEQLVIATGAECTKTLKQDNTHLITAHTLSEKCAAAKDWGINVVNHLWLEESYAKWQIQSLTNTKYTHFPDRTNLGEVVGHTRIDRDAVQRYFFADADLNMDEDSEDSPEPMKPRDLNVPAKSSVPATVTAVKSTKKEDRPETPVSRRHGTLGKENDTPTTTGSRKTKEAALTRLHSLSADIALYEKEKKRVGGVVYGGRRKSDEDRIEIGRKRDIDEASESDEIEENEAKRPKTGGLPPPTMRILVTGYKRWVGEPKTEDNDKKKLRALGIVITLSPARASHLAAPTIMRTHKFVTALAYAPIVISTDYIDKCLEEDEVPKVDKFLLKDPANEKRLGVSLKLSHDRATANQNQLLRDRQIFCLENIHGGFETFKSIVEANGGECMQYRGRPHDMISSTRAGSESSMSDEDPQNEVYLLSGPEPANKRFWSKFKDSATHSRKVPRIVTTEWLLETAMCQKIQPVANYEL